MKTASAALHGKARFTPNPNLRLKQQVAEVCRFRHLSLRTEQAYWHWIRRFVLFHQKRHPKTMGSVEVSAFLSDLAVRGRVTSSTQNQALNALVFLYRDVLGLDLGGLEHLERAKRPPRVPVVLSRDEVRRLLDVMSGTHQLMARLLYGTGLLRLMELLRLRIKDLDFDRGQIVVHEGKGAKDRVTVFPETLREPMRHHRRDSESTMPPHPHFPVRGVAFWSDFSSPRQRNLKQPLEIKTHLGKGRGSLGGVFLDFDSE